MPLPTLNMPNTGNVAAQILAAGSGQTGGNNNMAAVKLLELRQLQEEKRLEREAAANDYASNLLSGVKDDKTLTTAKGLFSARYPEYAGTVERLMPTYNEETKNLIINTLKTNKQKYGFHNPTPGSEIWIGDEKKGQVAAANKGTVDKGFAPDTEMYIKPETGETKPVNVRNELEVAGAEALGFYAPSPLDEGYLRELGKRSAEYESDVMDYAQKARGKIDSLRAMNDLLDRFESGKLKKLGMRFQQYANAFGLPVDTENLSAAEVFDALANKLTQQARAGDRPGETLAGQMSDRDVQFLRDMNPQLILSKGGNRKLIRMYIKLAERGIERARHLRTYKKVNKGRFTATGFEEYMAQYADKNSVFGIPEGAVFIGTDDKRKNATGLPIYQLPDGRKFIPEF
jgi:hypothetical protein